MVVEENESALEDLSNILDLSKLGRAPGRFSLDQLTKLNSSQLSILSFKEIKDRLKNENIIAYEPLWEIVKNNIDFLSEYSKWDKIINEDIEIENFENEFLKLAADALPDQPWDEKTWNLWIEKIKASTDRKGKDLYLPLRKAITGLEDGPELKELILLIGYDKIKKRLLGE